MNSNNHRNTLALLFSVAFLVCLSNCSSYDINLSCSQCKKTKNCPGNNCLFMNGGVLKNY